MAQLVQAGRVSSQRMWRRLHSLQPFLDFLWERRILVSALAAPLVLRESRGRGITGESSSSYTAIPMVLTWAVLRLQRHEPRRVVVSVVRRWWTGVYFEVELEVEGFKLGNGSGLSRRYRRQVPLNLVGEESETEIF